MTGVKKLSSCGVAAFLYCGSAMAASPTGSFDAWSVTGGTITSAGECPEGFTCVTAVTGEVFFQRQITETTAGTDFFQTIITDKTVIGSPGELTFSDESYVSTGSASGLADQSELTEESTSGEDHIKAIWVGQDMSAISGVGQEFGFSAYEDFSSTPGMTNTFSLLREAIDSACISSPTGTVASSSFIPASSSAVNDFGYSRFVIEGGGIKTDFTPPTVTAPADIKTTISGHANFFDLDPINGGLLPEVTDDQTESFDYSSADNVAMGPLPPGRHTVTWQAKDNAGNEGSAVQQIDILPSANFQTNQITGEAKWASVRVYLNGSAPEYPVLIPYTVSGTATSAAVSNIDFDLISGHGDHNANNGVITIDSGTIGQTSFYVGNDGTTEAEETVVFTMGTPTNADAGINNQHTVTITDNPQTLTLDFVVAQNNQISPLVTTENGVIRVSAIARNENYLEPVSYDWSQSNSSLVSADCNQSSFYVDPANLATGLYQVHVNAAETGLPDQAASAEWWLRVGTAPTLNSSDDRDSDGVTDSDEGYQDNDNDGIPNYLDVIDAAHLIPGFWKGNYKSLEGKTLYNQHEPLNGAVGWSVSGTTAHINYPMLIATEPGLKFGAGSIHLWNYEHTRNVAFNWNTFIQLGQGFGTEPNTSFQINGQEINFLDLVDPLFNPEDATQNDEDLFMVSLEISHLAKSGDTVRLVIPQTSAVHNNEGYNLAVRSYNPAFGWQNLLEDNNQISSALREGDYCPPAGSNQYQAGLVEGFECLQLSLEDGGANDADGYRNGRISFNGGVLPVVDSEHPQKTIETEGAESLSTSKQSDQNSDTQNGGGGAISPLLLTLLLLRKRIR